MIPRRLWRWIGAALLAVAALTAVTAAPALASGGSGSNQYTEGYGCNNSQCRSTTFVQFHVTWNSTKVWINTPITCPVYNGSLAGGVKVTWCWYVNNGTGSFNAGFNETIGGISGYWLRVDVKPGTGGCDVRGNLPGNQTVTYCKGAAG